MTFAKQERVGVIFVTDDTKGDWWERNGSNLLFHEQLMDEFKRETLCKVKNHVEYLDLLALTPNEFYSAVSNGYDILKSDMVELALRITDDEYIASIEDEVFSEIESDLAFSGDQYLDFCEHSLGTEGIDVWEIDSNDLVSYETYDRDERWIVYKLTYQVEMSGTSHDYWGSDEDTKEVLLSRGCRHEAEGEVEVLVRREVGEFTDFESDLFFESATLCSASFIETGFEDYDYDGESDYED